MRSVLGTRGLRLLSMTAVLATATSARADTLTLELRTADTNVKAGQLVEIGIFAQHGITDAGLFNALFSLTAQGNSNLMLDTKRTGTDPYSHNDQRQATGTTVEQSYFDTFGYLEEDLNGDGEIDLADYEIFGIEDFNGDGVGDASDLEHFETVTFGNIADASGDGVLNSIDIAAFYSAYGSGDPSADLNGDGFLNFFDISDFFGAYDGGKPDPQASTLWDLWAIELISGYVPQSDGRWGAGRDAVQIGVAYVQVASDAAAGDALTIQLDPISAFASLQGTFTELSTSATSITLTVGDGGQLVVVPEPASLALVLTAAVGLAARRRRSA